MPFAAGIDSGTQSTKVLVVDGEGRVHGRGQAPHALVAGLPAGHKEQHPADWWRATVDAFRQAHAEAGRPRIDAIGVSGQQHGFVPLGADGEAIRPAKLWNDTATAPQAQAIVDAVGGPARYFQLVGQSLAVGFTASKILWLKENEPENYRRLATVLLPHDYLNFKLVGEASMEWGDASGTGLMDVRTRQWRREVVGAIDADLAVKLPPLRDSAEPAGTLAKAAAEELGCAPGALVSAGGGDNMMGAIGTGNVVAGVVTASLGTSGTIHAHSDAPVVDPEGMIAAFCGSAGGWLPLLCTMNVTVATELAAKLFGLGTEELNRAAASVPPGSGGLMLLPYFEGERVPAVPDGAGVWFGARDANATPAHYCRAAMEGATLGLAHGWQRMKALGVDASEVRLTGGGSKSALWRSIVADCLGAPVVCTTEPEGAALGAALQALWTLERQSDPSATIESVARRAVRLDESTRAEPDPGRAALYAELLALHADLSLALRGAFARHRALFP